MPTADQLLQTTYGYAAFRGQQRAIIDTVAGGRDAFVLMPTSGGKSLCYQIPALVRPGVGSSCPIPPWGLWTAVSPPPIPRNSI